MPTEQDLAEARKRIIVALDGMTPSEALHAVRQFGPHVGMFKIGYELILAFLASIVRLDVDDNKGAVDAFLIARMFFRELNGNYMLDPKILDIEQAMSSATANGVVLLNPQVFTIHASAGVRRMRAVVKAANGRADVVGVTLLTDSTDAECFRAHALSRKDIIRRFTADAIEAGVQCLVCAPGDLAMLRDIPGFDRLKKITPGVRPKPVEGTEGVKNDDQNAARSMTPGDAIRAGAHYLVIGRPITKPVGETSIEAVQRITADIAEALSEVQPVS
jgi:orotidine-5'-phosphate decarboxylase